MGFVPLAFRAGSEPRSRVHIFWQNRIGRLRVDLARREVTVGGRPVHLTPNEFRLLSVLVKHAGKVLTHRQLLREVWGPGSGNETHYLRVYLNQLRQKLEAEPARPKYLLTETGVGYRLVDAESPDSPA